MATAKEGYAPIDYAGSSNALLQSLLGQQTRQSTSGNTSGASSTAGTSSGSTTGVQTSNNTGLTTNTADLAPLMQIFSQASQGMDPATLSALISSIFTEGAQQVPSLIGAYANSTGSRASRNSGTALALDELNRNLSTQAVQALLNYNTQGQQTAANAATQIAANTRQTAQTGQTAQATNNQTQQQQQQQQVQTGTQQQTQTGRQAANPSMMGLLGLGGTALNFLDKKGALDFIKGGAKNPAGGVGAVGSISPTATNLSHEGIAAGAPAAESYSLGAAPAASSGMIATPAVAPSGPAIGTSTMAPAGSSPSFVGSGGTASTAGGLGSAAGGFNLGNGLPDWATGGSSFFGGGGLADYSSLGGVGVGLAPNDIGGFAVGNDFITGGGGSLLDAGASNGPVVLGGAGGDFGGFGSMFEDSANWADSIGSSLGGLFGGAADWIGSFFADGGMVGAPYPGDTVNVARTVNPAFQYRPIMEAYRAGPGLENFADGGCVTTAGTPRSAFSGLSLSDVVPGQPRQYADGGGIGAVGDGRYGAPVASGGAALPMPTAKMNPMNLFQAMQLRNQEIAGLVAPPEVMQQGTRTVSQQPTMPVSSLLTTIPQLLQSMMSGYADGGMIDPTTAYADGGQVQTGGSTTRNRNNMGPQLQRRQQSALNYDGYAEAAPPAAVPTAAVGASIPAGVSPVAASPANAISNPGANVAPTSTAMSVDPREMGRQLEQFIAARYPERVAAPVVQDQGAGDAATSGQDEGSNAAAGIGPSGIAAAPTGTTSAIGAIGSMAGIVGIGSVLAMMASLASQVNAANQGMMGHESTGHAPGGASGGISGSSVGESGTEGSVSVGASSSTSGDADGGSGATGPGGDSSTGEGGTGSWADGGLVRGPGTGTSDSIRVKSREAGGKPISYSDGEYVIPADVVQALGKEMFDGMIASFHTPVSR